MQLLVRPASCRGRAPARRAAEARVAASSASVRSGGSAAASTGSASCSSSARCSRLSSAASRRPAARRGRARASGSAGAPPPNRELPASVPRSAGARAGRRDRARRRSPVRRRGARVQLGRPAGVDELSRDPQERAHAAARDAQLMQVLGVDREPCAGVVGDQRAALGQKLRLEPPDLGARRCASGTRRSSSSPSSVSSKAAMRRGTPDGRGRHLDLLAAGQRQPPELVARRDPRARASVRAVRAPDRSCRSARCCPGAPPLRGGSSPGSRSVGSARPAGLGCRRRRSRRVSRR